MDVVELIHSIDIVEYISQYVDLVQKGNEWWGLSCFKEEHTPSFSVRQNPPFFYDYSSGKGGNVFTFVKEYNHCSSREAIQILKDYAGIDGEISEAEKEFDTTRVLKKFRRLNQKEKKPNATVLPEDYMERYEIRRDKLDVWLEEGISAGSMKKFDVRYDGFSNRIVYPIKDLDGNIVNVGGRTLDQDYKEKSIRKYTYFFKWGAMDVIYGLYDNMDAIKEAGEVILFEGCKSVLIADTWGIHNCGALLTSHLNKYQMKILARLGCRVVFALDKEIDVRNDANVKTLKNYVLCERIRDLGCALDDKDSPVDKGIDVFRDVYENRQIIR